MKTQTPKNKKFSKADAVVSKYVLCQVLQDPLIKNNYPRFTEECFAILLDIGERRKKPLLKPLVVPKRIAA